jgi:hypothetical protein
MIHISTRPITEQEIKLLSAHCRIFERNPLIIAIITTSIFMFLMCVLVTVTFLLPKSNEYNLLFYSLTVVFLILSVYLAYKIYPRKRKPILEEVLDDTVEILDVEASDAIKIEEFEDEGIGYYLNIGDGKVLFIQGQYLYDDNEDSKAYPKIPSTRMSINRAAISKIPLDVKFVGEYLSPSHTNPPFTTEEYENNRVPEDSAILEVDFESLKK